MDALDPMNAPWLPAEWARDQRLSFGARGVLAELVATAPGAEMSVASLAATGGWDEDATVIEAHLVELERAGYLIREEPCWFLCDPFAL